jgi:hypothetical protein
MRRGQQRHCAPRQADTFEDCGRVVQDSIDIGPLLARLCKSTNSKTLVNGLGGQQTTVLEEGNGKGNLILAVQTQWEWDPCLQR